MIIAEIRRALAEVRRAGRAPQRIVLNADAADDFVDEARRMVAWGEITADLVGVVYDGVPMGRNIATWAPRVQILLRHR